MRHDNFLRTPIRGDHQSRLRDLAIGEAALEGDPTPGTPYPQTLEVSFRVDAGVTEVQIAPLWEGQLQFVPDSVAGNPTTPDQVLESRFGTWSVVGDLVLRTLLAVVPGGHETAFTTHLPTFTPIPTTVRYSKIRLTPEFVFTTLKQARRLPFSLAGVQILVNDPLYHQKRVVSFLSGSGRVACTLDATDPTLDTALLPMPAIQLAALGGTTVLRVSVAALSEEVLTAGWFTQRPAYDDLSGERLVPAALDNAHDLLTNPGHPSHSVVPAWALFLAAPDAAFAPDQPLAAPLRAALAAPRPDGRTYRRIAAQRPPLPGTPVGSAPARALPGYRLCWRPTGGGATESLRLPLSGVVHVPLLDGTHTFWAIPRSKDPAVVIAGDAIRFSLPPVPPRKAGGEPLATVDLPLGSSRSATLDTHVRGFDAAMAWEGYRALTTARLGALRAKAKSDWNIDVTSLKFFLPTDAAHRPQAALYGLIRESAGRHGLSPEFLQVVFFGEGGARPLPAGGGFAPDQVLDAFGFVGLDLIVYRTGRLPLGRPAVPPEVPAGALKERAEFAFNLVTQGYVDPATAARVNWTGPRVRAEAGFTRTLEIGTVTGWAAAVELVAAELHARLDEMTTYLASKSTPFIVSDELTRRFLAYLRFNARPTTAQNWADALPGTLTAWVGPRPPSNENVRFNTLERLAITQWHDAVAAYREAQ